MIPDRSMSDGPQRHGGSLPAGPTLPTRTARTIAAFLLVLGLAACGMGANGGGDGRVEELPSTVPPGTDPAEGGTTCVISGQTFDDDVTIPTGIHCVFNDVIIEGNLVLAPNTRVEQQGGRVDGNVLVYPNAEYVADLGAPVTIGGDAQAEEAASVLLGGAELDGNLQTLRTEVVEASGGTIGGNVQNDRGGTVTITGVAVGGNIQPLQNSGHVTIEGNTVDGDVQPKENTGGVTITNNQIGGNLQCEGNAPPPTGGGNIVQGDAEGQCAGLDT